MKFEKLVNNIIRIIYLLFIFFSIGLLICFLFFRNINGIFAKIIGTIYLIIVLLTALSTIYYIILGVIYAFKDKTIKDLIQESLQSAIFALLVIIVYSLIIYHKIVIGTDYIIIIVFFMIPAFRKYLDIKGFKFLKK